MEEYLIEEASNDGSTASIEWKAELMKVLHKNYVCAICFLLLDAVILIVLMSVLAAYPFATQPFILVPFFVLYMIWLFLCLCACLVCENLLTHPNLDVDGDDHNKIGNRIGRWWRLKALNFSLLLPYQHRPTVRQILHLMHRHPRIFISSDDHDQTLSSTEVELAWELKTIFSENCRYAFTCVFLSVTVMFMLIALSQIIASALIFVWIFALTLVFVWIFMLLWAHQVNEFLLFNLKLGEGDPMWRWWRKKVLAFSLRLPYQDRSSVQKILQIMGDHHHHCHRIINLC